MNTSALPLSAAAVEQTPPAFAEATARRAWWQPPAVLAPRLRTAARAGHGGDGLAFGALIAFTLILLLSPQIWFPILGALRIAFLAAGLAIVAHVMDRTVHQQSITPSTREITLAV